MAGNNFKTFKVTVLFDIIALMKYAFLLSIIFSFSHHENLGAEEISSKHESLLNLKYKHCSIEKSCEDGFICAFLTKYKSSMCIKRKDACSIECGKKKCKIMYSYPVQIGCS